MKAWSTRLTMSPNCRLPDVSGPPAARATILLSPRRRAELLSTTLFSMDRESWNDNHFAQWEIWDWLDGLSVGRAFRADLYKPLLFKTGSIDFNCWKGLREKH